MDDARLAEALIQISAIEREALAQMARTSDSSERAHAEIVMRQAGSVRKPLEKWITARAMRAVTTR